MNVHNAEYRMNALYMWCVCTASVANHVRAEGNSGMFIHRICNHIGYWAAQKCAVHKCIKCIRVLNMYNNTRCTHVLHAAQVLSKKFIVICFIFSLPSNKIIVHFHFFFFVHSGSNGTVPFY